MIRDWRRMLTWRREARMRSRKRRPTCRTRSSDREEPALRAGDENVGRMEFLLTLRRRGISDQAVLRAMDEVPREHFVLPEFADTAYADQALPIACGQTISQPYVVAYMTEQLERARAASRARGRHRLGLSGGGAVAARREVVTVERYRTLADAARERARRRSAATTSTVLVGDGLDGVPEHAPYDRIIVTAAAETIPEALVEQLAEERRDGAAARAARRRAAAGQADQGARTGSRSEDLIGGALRAAAARAGARIVRIFADVS